MSSLAVRTLADQWALADASLPYYPTINQQTEPTDDIWLTLEFQAYGNDLETYCGSTVERGEIILVFMGLIGIGDDTLIAAAETYSSNYFDNNQDPAGKLVLVEKQPISDYQGNGNRYICEIAIQYEYRS